MRRLPSILLLLAFLALGSGTLSRLHDHAHEMQDAAAHAGSEDASHERHPAHDEGNCDLHALLRAPLASAGWVPLLISLGLFVAFLTLLAPPLSGRLALFSVDCRGPPVR